MLHCVPVTDRNLPEYATALEQARMPMGQHAIGYQEALEACPHEEALRVVAHDGDTPVGAAAGMLYDGGPVRMVESLPYGYGGAACSLTGEEREACIGLLCESLVELAEKAGARLLTIQTPPFPDGPDVYRRVFRPDFELRSFTQYVDLEREFQPPTGNATGKCAGYRGALRRNHRRNIRKAEEAGVTAGPDDSAQGLERYLALQRKRMGEIGVRPRPDAFFSGIRRHMVSQGTGWYFYAKKGDEILSGTPLIGIRDVVDTVLLCTDSDAAAMQPNALLCYRAMEWAVEHGFSLLNLQSSLRRGDSLYQWKMGWGAKEAPVSILTRVIGDIEPILRLPREELIAAYTYHYVLPYRVLDAAQEGHSIYSPELRVLEKGT